MKNNFLLNQCDTLREKLLLVPLAKIFMTLLIGIVIGNLVPSISLYAIPAIAISIIVSVIIKTNLPYTLVILLGISLNYLDTPEQKAPHNKEIAKDITIIETLDDKNYIADIDNERVLLLTNAPLHRGDLIHANVILESLEASSLKGRSRHIDIGIESYAKTTNDNIKSLGTSKPAVKHIYEIRKFFFSTRQYLLKRADRLNIGKENRAIAKALILGDRKGISSQTNSSYAACGVSHILSISGLHIGIVFLILSTIFIIVPRRYIRTIVVVLLLWFYVFISGAAPSAMRAAFMLTLLQFCYTYTKSRYQMYNILFASAIFFLLIDHTLISNVGFQLSYLAIFAILFLYYRVSLIIPIENQILNFVLSAILITLSVQIFTVPLVTYYFGVLSLTGILANTVFTLLLPILMWASIIYIAFPNYICEYIIKLITEMYADTINISENLPFSSITNYYTSTLDMVVYILLFIFTAIYFTYFYKIKKT